MANDGLEIPIGVTERQYMRQLARLEAATVRAAKRQETTFKRANEKMSRSWAGLDGLGVRANRSSRAFGGLSNSLRMTSLQLSQVFQSAQVTGQPLRALAVQMPDLGLAFGTVGIAAGIAGGALLSFLSGMGDGEAAKSLAEGLKEAASAMDGLKGRADELVDLERQLAQATALRGQAQVNVSSDVVRALETEIELRRRILEAERAQLEVSIGRLRDQVAEAREEFERLVAPPRAVTADDARLSDQERLQIQRALTEQTLEAVENNRLVALELAAQNAELQLMEAGYASIEAALDGTRDALVTADDAVTSMTTTLENAGMDGLIADAQALSEALGISLGYALQIAALGDGARAGSDPTFTGFRPEDPRSGVTWTERLRRGDFPDGLPSGTPSRPVAPAPASSSRSRGGGGGGQSQANDMMREGLRLTERLRTEQERYNDELARLEELFQAGAIGQETYDRALADLQERLGGLRSISGELGSAFDRMFRSVLDGSGNAASALRSFGLELARIGSYGLLRSFAPGLFGARGLIPLPNAMGNVFSGGRVVPFADGGVVSGPTLFPMANGTGLMGEAGPEAILPLKRINGRLGVEASGMGRAGSEVIVRLDVPEGVTVAETRQIAGDVAVRIVADNNRRAAQAERRRNGGAA
jgi:plasmid maintenance system antidote protein VapI